MKNGSERVVDDARSHISMIKMMKNFHFVDEKGKDQGINGNIPFLIGVFFNLCMYIVRNRAKELAELLNNIDLIKAERKKAKKNRNKYTGVGSEGGMSFSGGSSNYSGGSRFEGFGSSSGGGYSGNSGDFYDDTRSGRYDEPDASRRSPSPEPVVVKREQPKTAKDLFDFDSEPVTSNKQENEDEWGDFANGDGKL